MKFTESAKLLKAISTFILILFPVILFTGSAAIDVSISAIALFFLFNSMLTKKYDWIKERWIQAALLLWFYAVIRSLFTENINMALASTLPFCRFFLFTAAIYHWLLKEASVKDFALKSLTITVFIVSLNAIAQYFIGFDFIGGRPVDTGSFLRLTTFSGKMAIGILLASINFVTASWALDKLTTSKSYIKTKAFYIALVALPLFAIFLSGERTALLMTILGYAILFFKNDKYRVPLVLGLGAIVLISIVIMTQTNTQVLNRQIKRSYDEIEHFQSSSYGKIFNTGITIFKDNPIFGIGAKHFQTECNSQFAQQTNFYCSTHPHNIYIQMLVELGLVGFSLFLAMLYLIGKKCWDHRKKILKDSLAFGALLCFWFKYIPLISTSSYFIAWSVAASWFMLGFLFSRVNNAKN